MDTDYLLAQLVAFAKHEDCYPLDPWGCTAIGSIPPKDRIRIVTLGNNSECSLVFCQYLNGGIPGIEEELAGQIEKEIQAVYQNLFERTKLHVSFVDIEPRGERRDYIAVSFCSNEADEPCEVSTKRFEGGGKNVWSSINVRKFDPSFESVLPFAMAIFGFPAFKPLTGSGRPSGVNRLFLEEGILLRAVAEREFIYVAGKLRERRPSTDEADIEFLRGDRSVAKFLSRVEAEERAYREELEKSVQGTLD